MKIHFLIHLFAGVILGIVSLMFLPRFGYLDRKFFIGFGLFFPWVLTFIIIGLLFFYFDTSILSQKLLKIGLMLLVEIVTIFIVIKSIKLGF